MTLGSLYVDTQVCVPVVLDNLHGMSCSGANWFLGGGWFWMVSYSLMFHVLRSFLVLSGLGLSLLPLDFSFILPIVSRLLQLYSTVNREKILHCEGQPERFTELHEE